jgi:hypothetical protein
MNPTSVNEVEAALQQLPGIHVARVTFEEDAKTIQKIHVLIAPERTPKKVVRDIESFMLLRFNTRLDYRKVSLIHGSAETMKPALKPRPKLLAVERQPIENALRVTVRLDSEGQICVGEAEGPSEIHAQTLAAEATLDAIRQIVADATLSLGDAEVVPMQKQYATLIRVVVTDEHGDEELLGATLVREELLVSVARATLDALNRRFFSAW